MDDNDRRALTARIIERLKLWERPDTFGAVVEIQSIESAPSDVATMLGSMVPGVLKHDFEPTAWIPDSESEREQRRKDLDKYGAQQLVYRVEGHSSTMSPRTGEALLDDLRLLDERLSPEDIAQVLGDGGGGDVDADATVEMSQQGLFLPTLDETLTALDEDLDKGEFYLHVLLHADLTADEQAAKMAALDTPGAELPTLALPRTFAIVDACTATSRLVWRFKHWRM